jgi:DNA-binding IclR family transcriptional regulator
MSQTVDRALSILIDLGTGPKSLDQVAALLGVHKSTALRLLQTLEAQGFARHDEQHRYRLGPRLFALAHQALDDLDIRRLAAPHLAALNQLHGHTVHLAAYLDGAVVYIDKYDSKHPVRMGSRIGATAPAHCTAVGKVLLAGLPAARRHAAVERLQYPKYTPHTITDPALFLAELDRVAAQGYAQDRAEYEDYINCVAAPIHDAAGNVPAAASISVPEPALDYRGVLALLPDLRAAVAAASAELGWSAPNDQNSQIPQTSQSNQINQDNREN